MDNLQSNAGTAQVVRPRKAITTKPAKSPDVRLMAKAEILEITGVSFPTIWAWMRRGVFPRSRIVGGRCRWLSSDVQTWLEGLPVRRYKGDAA